MDLHRSESLGSIPYNLGRKDSAGGIDKSSIMPVPDRSLLKSYNVQRYSDFSLGESAKVSIWLFRSMDASR